MKHAHNLVDFAPFCFFHPYSTWGEPNLQQFPGKQGWSKLLKSNFHYSYLTRFFTDSFRCFGANIGNFRWTKITYSLLKRKSFWKRPWRVNIYKYLIINLLNYHFKTTTHTEQKSFSSLNPSNAYDKRLPVRGKVSLRIPNIPQTSFPLNDDFPLFAIFHYRFPTGQTFTGQVWQARRDKIKGWLV